MTKASAQNIKDTNNNNNFFLFLKGLIISIIVTFLCIIVFAFIIKWANLDDKIIAPVNLIIKAICIIIGTICYTKTRTGGLKKGIIFAISYISLAFVIFSLLSGNFNFSISLLLDYLFGILIGAIVGIIRVNAKQKNI